VALDAAAVVNYYRFYYHAVPHPSLSALANYLVIALFETFVPAVIGLGYTHVSGVAVAACIVMLTALAVTLYLRPRAWRCLMGFILAFLITMVPIGLNKISAFGVTIARVFYYQQSVQFMFLVFAAFAISSRWSGRRARPELARLRPAASRWSAPMLRRPSRLALAACGIAVAAVYGTLYVTSVLALEHQVWQGGKDSAYVREYLASDRQIRTAIGREPVLVDLDVPTLELPGHLAQVPTYGVFLALFNPNLRVDELANPVYVLDARGGLVPVRLVRSTRGLLGQASVAAAGGSPEVAAARRDRSRACVPARRSASWLQVPLARPQRLSAQPQGLPYAVRLHFSMPTGSSVPVRLVAWRGGRGFATISDKWSRGSGGRLIPLDFTGQLRELDFRLPARACITGLTVGRLRYTHSR
jgi:hypothetical protein